MFFRRYLHKTCGMLSLTKYLYVVYGYYICYGVFVILINYRLYCFYPNSGCMLYLMLKKRENIFSAY